MATHAASFYVTWSHECAEQDNPTSAESYWMVDQPWLIGADGFEGPLGAGTFAALSGLCLPTCGRGGMRVARNPGSVSEFHGVIRDGGGAPHAAHTYGTGEWEIDGVALANGVETFLSNQRFPPANPRLVIGGAALAAIGGAATTFDGVVTIRYQALNPRFGRSCFDDFVSIPPDNFIGVPDALARLRAKIAQSGSSYSLGTQADGTERVLQSCQFAGLDPAGWVWIRPEDIGNQIEQIPAQVQNNTPEHFRFYPNAFYRRVSYVDGLGLACVDSRSIVQDPGPASPSQPFRIIQVNFAPASSTWLFIIDGQPICVRLDHPSGSDLRRPDEIWNALIVPLIQNVQGPASAVSYLNPVLFLVGLPDEVGLLDKMRYLQYARMLSVNDEEGDFDITDFPQWEEID